MKLLFSICLLFIGLSAFAAQLDCPVCGMHFKEDAKTSFESVRDGKPIHLCSFSCARRVHKKTPAAALKARDFETGAALDARTAWFLVKSKNVLKELDFDMPPSIVAFATEDAAKKARARLKDGEVVKGFDAVEKAYE
jgi:YHS domain-containing protein